MCFFRALAFCSATQFLKFSFEFTQLGIDAHLAVELFFFDQLDLCFFYSALQDCKLTHSLHLIGQLFLRACGQADELAQ